MVVRINSNSSIMSSTLSFVLVDRVSSSLSQFLMISKVLLIGVFVNNETTSCELKMSPSSIHIPLISSANCLELVTWCSDCPTIGDKMSASALDVW